MYSPTYGRSLAQETVPHKRILLMGYPGTGKTWAALTFPNPVVVNFDRGLAAHIGKEGIIDIPFYDSKFVDTQAKRTFATAPCNKRDGFMNWVRAEAPKFEKDQTLIIDSWTSLQNGFDTQQKLEPAFSKNGQEDKFSFWRAKIDFSREVCEALKALPCDVIVVAHEIIERDDDGRATGKARPLMSGQFADEFPSHFSDVFRQLAINTYKDPTNTKSEILGTRYCWQTQADGSANCKTMLAGAPKLIDANFTEYMKFIRKPIST
jgi:hypothetical protein